MIGMNWARDLMNVTPTPKPPTSNHPFAQGPAPASPTPSTVDAARQEFLDDRAHAEMREDTALERNFNELKRLGIHPHTIAGTSGTNSHAHIQSRKPQENDGLRSILDLAMMGIMIGMTVATKGKASPMLIRQMRRMSR